MNNMQKQYNKFIPKFLIVLMISLITLHSFSVSAEKKTGYDKIRHPKSKKVILARKDLPDTFPGYADMVFYVSGKISAFEFSPNGQWLALKVDGGVHSYGWIYDIKKQLLIPAAFAFDCFLNLDGWDSTGRFVAFTEFSQVPDSRIKVVDIQAKAGKTALDTGFYVKAPFEKKIKIDTDEIGYTFEKWKGQELYFSLACFDCKLLKEKKLRYRFNPLTKKSVEIK